MGFSEAARCAFRTVTLWQALRRRLITFMPMMAKLVARQVDKLVSAIVASGFRHDVGGKSLQSTTKWPRRLSSYESRSWSLPWSLALSRGVPSRRICSRSRSIP